MGDQQSSYRVMQGMRDGLPAIIMIDTAFDPDSEGTNFPWLITINLPLLAANEQGLCGPEENERLNNLEDSLLETLIVSGYRYAGRITWNRVRSVMIYVAQPDVVIAEITAAFESTDADDVTLVKQHDPGWKEYRKLLG